jgi:hypothetical protein
MIITIILIIIIIIIIKPSPHLVELGAGDDLERRGVGRVAQVHQLGHQPLDARTVEATLRVLRQSSSSTDHHHQDDDHQDRW